MGPRWPEKGRLRRASSPEQAARTKLRAELESDGVESCRDDMDGLETEMERIQLTTSQDLPE